MVFQAQASQQKLEEMGSSRPAVREAVVPGQMLFVMGIVKAQDDGWRRRGDMCLEIREGSSGGKKARSTQTGKSARSW